MPARTIDVLVKPNAKTSELSDNGDGTWTARIAAPPVDGKANEALIALVAKHFGCAKSRVTIKSGASGRRKRLVVEDGG
ncbi:DUF167 domain-containing protein [Hydrogenophaga sp.]|uniref:DUF167 domain-containing protein n=1 Tax=Hydrogenophaga sp. TaxID=1904254 RepID=UPI0025BB792E|nr:DUF167 domain-containing protein [Hydrogenophaga sp.]